LHPLRDRVQLVGVPLDVQRARATRFTGRWSQRDGLHELPAGEIIDDQAAGQAAGGNPSSMDETKQAERAALAWAEAVNAIPQRTPSDAEFAALRDHFEDSEIAALTFVVCAIRAFNMLNVSFCSPVPDEPYVAND
jgi:alkylhydroperoxidase family enzyme